MSEITLEQMDERIAKAEKRLSRYKSAPRHGEFQSYALLEEQASEELEILKLARRALSQGDVVFEGYAHLYLGSTNGVPEIAVAYESDQPDVDDGVGYHVTIRRPK